MKRLALLVAVASVAGLLGTGGYALHKVGRAEGYAPRQPIAFSHALHAGDHAIPCLYCHSGAERSRHAGIPASGVCMGCHQQLTVASRDLAKLVESYRQDRPIAWIRVHDLPDFAFFHHAQHVRVAGIDCAVCHGPVAAMQRLRQHAPLTMGWCIDCHRRRGIAGGLDCSKCHL